MPTCRAILQELRRLGTAQNRKVYRRHGVDGELFGVSSAHLGKLTRKIGTDHDLAVALWESGNHDARVLATMVADPKEATLTMVNAWGRQLSNYVITDALAGFVGKTPFVQRKMEQWTRARNEWTCSVGLGLLGRMALSGDDFDDAVFDPYLARIEQEIHDQANRVRHTMNLALIAIGCRHDALAGRAIEIAGRIGKVEVDHGATGCKTPDAAAYIRKTRAYRKKKAGRKRAGARS